MFRDGDLRAIVAGRGFRRLLWSRLTSQVADGFFQAGLAGSVLFNPDRRTSALAIALGFAVLVLPYSLVGPYVGVFLDRWSRRDILFVSNLLRAALVAPAAILIWFGDEHFIFVVFALGVIAVNRFVLAGLSAALPHVVEQRRLVTGNSLSTTLGSVCFSLGLGAAALAQQLIGPSSHSYGAISLCATIGYAASAVIARFSFSRYDLGPDTPDLAAPQPRPDMPGAAAARRSLLAESVDVARGMVSGAKHLADRRGAAYPLIAQAIHRGLYGVLAISTLLLYRNYFTTDDDFASSISGLGQIVIAGAVGSLVAATITPSITRRIGGRAWITLLLCAVGAALLVLGLPFQHLLLVALVMVINVASQGTKIVVDTAIQQECADDHRGWVFSLNDTTFNLCFVAGLFVGAQSLPSDGHSPVVLVGVVFGYALLATWFWWVTGRWARRSDHDPSRRSASTDIATAGQQRGATAVGT